MINQSQNSTQPQQPPLFILQILWGALLFSNFTYLMVVMTKDLHVTDWNELINAQNGIYILMAVATLVASVVVPDLLFPKKRLANANDLKEAGTKYMTPFIIKLALTESVSLFGLLLAMQVGQEAFYPFLAVAVLRFLSLFPSKNHVLKQFFN